MRVQHFNALTTTIALVGLLSLTACDKKPDERTVGQKLDSTIDKIDQKTDQAKAEIKNETAAAKESTNQTVDSATAKLKDATITTSVKAELVKDSSLSALKIDVDTTNGIVTLHGTAPSSVAREHATQLAKKIDGVVSVDNQLQIKS